MSGSNNRSGLPTACAIIWALILLAVALYKYVIKDIIFPPKPKDAIEQIMDGDVGLRFDWERYGRRR